MNTCTIRLYLVLIISLSFIDYANALRPRILKADGTEANYFTDIKILYGNPLELYCVGQAHNELMMSKDNVMFYTNTVNETTVHLFDEKPEIRLSNVYCHYVKGHDNTNIAAVRVLIDTLPKATNFHCNSNLKQHICTWTTPNLIIYRFSLYHVRDNVYTLLCHVMQSEPMYCAWDSKALDAGKPDPKILTFQMETCNHFGCRNETFEVHNLTIVKSEPPEQLTILWKRSHSASLSWKIPKNQGLSELHMDHKISYWHSGIHPRYVNTSNVFKQENYLVLNLELPCADTFYEVRVSIKPHGAVGEEYWSDDAVVTLVTDPQPANVDAEVDRSCIHSQSRFNVTPDVMLYKIYQFNKKISQEQIRLQNVMSMSKIKGNKSQG